MAEVYVHRRKDSGEVFYVGQSIYSGRKNQHTNRNKSWHTVVKTANGFDIEVLYENISKEDSLELENLIILSYGRVDNKTGILCNMTDGGNGSLNRMLSNKSKKKMSDSSKGILHSEETKNKISLFQKGKKDSLKTKNKKSNSLKNYYKNANKKDLINRKIKELSSVSINQNKKLKEYIDSEDVFNIKRKLIAIERTNDFIDKYKNWIK